jgi:hypothetical protein
VSGMASVGSRIHPVCGPAVSRGLWAGSMRLCSIRGRRCASRIGLVGER